jgi:hypothetical protein
MHVLRANAALKSDRVSGAILNVLPLGGARYCLCKEQKLNAESWGTRRCLSLSRNLTMTYLSRSA